MHVLLDGDILRYEIGYAVETGWAGEGRPSWNYVDKLLNERIDRIVDECKGSSVTIYLTEGLTFRNRLAKRKPYKGTRKEEKPWHYRNISAYLKALPYTEVVRNIEADDAISIAHIASPNTIIATRDKDLRQVPGWFYSWEVGNQPSYGPIDIPHYGDIWLDDRGSLKGNGLAWFYGQTLIGDVIDNVPGCPKIGPQKAYAMLRGQSPRHQLEAVIRAYRRHYGGFWKRELLEQGRLLWMTRRMSNNYPVMWRIGMTE